MKNYHRSIRIQGLQRGLEQQLDRQGHLLDPPMHAVAHYPSYQIKNTSSPSSAISLAGEAPFHVLAEGDR